ncbi:MAG: primase protein [candidate division TM6 bacterium GW2011_GWF2_32_72]|nr:MAG: primase protein [candidate division TM6 bacterium GW2011_GWF2_32_72]
MNLFDFIKTRIPILNVIQDYTSLKKAGKYWKGRCPFHSEKTASFTVSPEREIFYCFGCHLSGDVISFVAKIENCNQLEAAKLLAEKHKIDIPEDIMGQAHSQNHEEKQKHFDACRHSADWFHESLKSSKIALSYLKKRGLDEGTINRYKIGYFPGDLGAIKKLIKHAQSNSILTKNLIEANILFEGKSILYSPFEERIIFPITDHLGRFCGFGGRIFKPNDERAKYYNSKENPSFTKGSLLFGLDLAKKEIQNKNALFLVEGYTDCVAMAQHGIQNVVATLGTSCTRDHLKLVSRYAEQLFIIYDGDNAGEAAVLRLTKLCWESNIDPKVIMLPRGEDPASFLEKGGDLLKLCSKSQDIFMFFLNTIGKGFTGLTLNKKLQTIREFIQVIGQLDDDLKKDILLQNASKVFEVPFDTLKKELDQILESPKQALHQAQEKSTSDHQEDDSLKKITNLEKQLFCAILDDNDLIQETDKEYIIAYMAQPLKGILEKLNPKGLNENNHNFKDLFNKLNNIEQKIVAQVLLETGRIEEAEGLNELILQFHKSNWKTIVNDIKILLSKANQDDTQYILQNFLKLKKKLLDKGLI